MLKVLRLVVVVTALAMPGQSLVARQAGSDLFQRALAKERAEGQLAEAIKIYERIVKEYASDRALAAKALLQLGVCYEKLGDAGARKAYEQLVRDFADQRESAASARARLAAMTKTAAPAATLASRLVWSGRDVDSEGGVSPDGRYLSYTDPSGHLAVRDLGTGRSERLTDGEVPPNAVALSSRIAADGRQVAFASIKDGGSSELRVARIGRRHSSVVYSNPETYVDPFGWSPDGRRIFVVLERQDGTVQIASVSAAGGDVQVLKSFDWRWPEARVSPDGRFIAYSIRPAEGALQRDLYLLATDGRREVPLIQHAANDADPVWTPDGSGVVFASDRSGSADLWLVRVADGRAEGSPALVKRNFARGRLLGFTRDGLLYYGAMAQSQDVYVGAIDWPSGRAKPGASPISERFVGSNFVPDWSPDGTRLLYASRRAGGASETTIVVRSMTVGTEREFTPRLQYFHRPRWASDTRTIVMQGKGLNGPYGFFSIDADTGKVATLVRSDAGSFPAHQAWSPDGATLFYSVRESNNDRIVARDVAAAVEREIHRPGGGEKAVSPDGKWLAVIFVDPDQSTALRLIPTAGGAAREVVRLRVPERVHYFGGLSWTPDGTRLLFVKSRDDHRELWQVDVESGRAAPTGLSVPGLQYVRLHPDGRTLAYSAGERREEVWVIENLLGSLPAAAGSRRSGGKR